MLISGLIRHKESGFRYKQRKFKAKEFPGQEPVNEQKKTKDGVSYQVLLNLDKELEITLQAPKVVENSVFEFCYILNN